MGEVEGAKALKRHLSAKKLYAASSRKNSRGINKGNYVLPLGVKLRYINRWGETWADGSPPKGSLTGMKVHENKTTHLVK